MLRLSEALHYYSQIYFGSDLSIKKELLKKREYGTYTCVIKPEERVVVPLNDLKKDCT